MDAKFFSLIFFSVSLHAALFVTPPGDATKPPLDLESGIQSMQLIVLSELEIEPPIEEEPEELQDDATETEVREEPIEDETPPPPPEPVIEEPPPVEKEPAKAEAEPIDPIVPPIVASEARPKPPAKKSPLQKNILSIDSDGAMTEPVAHPRNKAPKYTRLARRRRLEGTVTLRYEILANGNVGDVQAVSSSSHQILVNLAIKAVRGWRFTPPEKNGKPVRTKQLQKFSFSLRKSWR